jgi:hypothetical protein
MFKGGIGSECFEFYVVFCNWLGGFQGRKIGEKAQTFGTKFGRQPKDWSTEFGFFLWQPLKFAHFVGVLGPAPQGEPVKWKLLPKDSGFQE